MTTLICDCNKTMPLDREALVRTLGPDAADGLGTVHTLLCRREAGAFQRAAKQGDDLLVACTQERRLFLELNDRTEGAPRTTERPIRFVNIRETGGWSKDAAAAGPKIAALIALAQLPEADPVPVASYRSSGRTLVVGPAERAVAAAALLADRLDLRLLVQGGPLPQSHGLALQRGVVERVGGWLGAFEVSWRRTDPIDLDLCTRCNACIAACPEGAIDLAYAVDLARCTGHRACVSACGAAGAIDFDRPSESVTESFDLVLDLGPVPLIALHQPPQGYFHVADGDAAALARAVLELRDATGEFEKPKFFDYKQALCAHSRNEQIGCSACIDVCSAGAVRSDASRKGRSGGAGKAGIVVEPHLCVGCGACTTVCPSGALGYATPRADHQGRRIRTLLSTHARGGGRDAALLIHSQGRGAELLEALGRAARLQPGVHGVPARVLPLDVWHTASVGLDLWMAALAFGASQVWVLTTGEEAPAYRAALAAQMAVGQAILHGLGFDGTHLRLVEADDPATLDRALGAVPARGVARAAAFAVQADKRATLDLAIAHLLAEAPAPAPQIALPAGASPFGSLEVDTSRCTLCLSCVGACPSSALADNPDRPQLRFVEANCVQCGLCATTCPEQAITLQPRLWLAEAGQARRRSRVLHETEPFRCVRCAKPFGTPAAVERMAARLAGHPMFQGRAAERLKMCGDCRVIDLHRGTDEVRITDV